MDAYNNCNLLVFHELSWLLAFRNGKESPPQKCHLHNSCSHTVTLSPEESTMHATGLSVDTDLHLDKLDLDHMVYRPH